MTLIASIPNIFRIKKNNHFTFCNCSVNGGYATQIYRLCCKVRPILDFARKIYVIIFVSQGNQLYIGLCLPLLQPFILTSLQCDTVGKL